MVLLLVTLGCTTVISLGSGQFEISPAQLVESLQRALHFAPAADPGSPAYLVDAALWQVRIPRLVLGLLVGAALGIAGALAQSLFGNPLAEPGVIGITSGAALGAAMSIGLGITWFGTVTTPIFAFVFGLLTSVMVWAVARTIAANRMLSLLLVGIAINAMAGAATAFMIVISSTTARDAVVFWQMGSVNGATWNAVVQTSIPLVVAMLLVTPLVRKLDVLALGDRAAGHLGIGVARLRMMLMIAIALMTGAAVAFAGIIGFVGLVVPHAIRLLVGPTHRILLPLSVIGGALLVAIADLVARVAIAGADLPIGMLTSIIGAPVFLVLLRQTFGQRQV
nr:iron ABC transporter permease [Pseudoclavibacter sp. Marseille-Q3772]